MIYNYIIIGAGLSGLTTAKILTENQTENILVLDKSRGVGGRMATRRTQNWSTKMVIDLKRFLFL